MQKRSDKESLLQIPLHQWERIMVIEKHMAEWLPKNRTCSNPTQISTNIKVPFFLWSFSIHERLAARQESSRSPVIPSPEEITRETSLSHSHTKPKFVILLLVINLQCGNHKRMGLIVINQALVSDADNSFMHIYLLRSRKFKWSVSSH